MKHVVAKLGNMRKSVEWVVYPKNAGDTTTTVVIQSDKRIACFDPATRKGVLSRACPSGAYFLHLNPIMGAEPIEVPQELVDQALAARPKSGDQIGPGMVVA